MNRDGHSHLIGLIAAVCALAITGCGTSNSASSGTGSGNTLALEFANCMRSHGVPNFPDPGGRPEGDLKQAPAFRSAMQTCNKLPPAGTPTGTPLPEAPRIAALAQATCIRDHGVPNFPDPTFPSSGGEFIPPAPGFDPASPAFKHAAAECGVTSAAGLPHGG
jgi:hypothetical protein